MAVTNQDNATVDICEVLRIKLNASKSTLGRLNRNIYGRRERREKTPLGLTKRGALTMDKAKIDTLLGHFVFDIAPKHPGFQEIGDAANFHENGFVTVDGHYICTYFRRRDQGGAGGGGRTHYFNTWETHEHTFDDLRHALDMRERALEMAR